MVCGKRKISSKKLKRCVESVKKAQKKRYGYQRYNPYAVCRKSVLNAKDILGRLGFTNNNKDYVVEIKVKRR